MNMNININVTFIFQDEADAEEDDEDEEDETEKKGRKKGSPAIRRLTRLTKSPIYNVYDISWFDLTQSIQIWNETSPIYSNFFLFMKKKSKDAKSRRDSNASDKLEFTS